MDRDEPGGRLVQHPLGRPVVRAPDDAARRVPIGQLRRTDRCVAGPQRVMVVCPDRGLPTGRDRFQRVGSRPAAPPIRVPAVALEPRVGRQALVRLTQASEPIVEGRGVTEVDMARRHRGLCQVQVGVGQPGDRDLVRLEADALRERVGPCLEVHLGARERDPTVADPDRLDPAEPRVALERGDAAGDQRVKGHEAVSLSGLRGASRGLPARAPPRDPGPTRPAP